MLGDRSHLIRLAKPAVGGTVLESIVVSQTGPVVTVVSVQSGAGRPPALSSVQIVKVAGWAIKGLCSAAGGACGAPPYRITSQDPPTDEAYRGFLSVVDLPPLPHVLQPWVGTDPATVTGHPPTTGCDRTSLRGSGATGVTARSYVIPLAQQLPVLFGLTETRATFSSADDARAFVAGIAHQVASCRQHHVTVTVPQSTSFSTDRTAGWVWQLRQQVSKQKVVTFRVALVRAGPTVAVVTFTPVGTYDVPQPAFVALAERAAVRLND